MPDDVSGPIPRHVAQHAGWRASRLRELGYSSYRDYLHGEHWKATRERYWNNPRTPKMCVCGEYNPKRLALHHKTYLRLGRERLSDLMPLCPQCHNDVHVLAQRGSIGYGLEDYDDVRRRIMYAMERRKRLIRDGEDPESIPERPYDPHMWDDQARKRRRRDEVEIYAGDRAWRKAQARKMRDQVKKSW